ncbi:MAG: sulfotransferase [Rhodospirillales bacterium]
MRGIAHRMRRRVMRGSRRTCSLLARMRQGRRWLLKTPTDLFAMSAVLKVFPDAMIVQTHRDPLQAAAVGREPDCRGTAPV